MQSASNASLASLPSSLEEGEMPSDQTGQSKQEEESFYYNDRYNVKRSPSQGSSTSCSLSPRHRHTIPSRRRSDYIKYDEDGRYGYERRSSRYEDRHYREEYTRSYSHRYPEDEYKYRSNYYREYERGDGYKYERSRPRYENYSSRERSSYDAYQGRSFDKDRYYNASIYHDDRYKSTTDRRRDSYEEDDRRWSHRSHLPNESGSRRSSASQHSNSYRRESYSEHPVALDPTPTVSTPLPNKHDTDRVAIVAPTPPPPPPQDTSTPWIRFTVAEKDEKELDKVEREVKKLQQEEDKLYVDLTKIRMESSLLYLDIRKWSMQADMILDLLIENENELQALADVDGEAVYSNNMFAERERYYDPHQDALHLNTSI